MSRRLARRGWFPGAALMATATAACLLLPGPAQAQGVMDRSPNLSGGWVGEPGAVHFNLLHRFWVVNSGDDDKLVNSPTMLVAAPLPARTLVGARYASNSLVASGRFNEWELFGRWGILEDDTAPLALSFGGGYNGAAGSFDAEVAGALPLGGVRLLGTLRGFSDARGSGEAGWAAGGGALVQLRDHVAVAGDLGASWVDGDRSRTVWGAALQLRIPTTPHTVSIQATNSRTGTLQGASTPDRTTWGFEFTVPVTFARYSARFRSAPEADEQEPARSRDGVVEVTMSQDLRFVPDTVEVQVGDTVIWTNTSQEVHTVTAHPDRVRDPEQIALPEGAAPFDSGNMFQDDVFRHVFTVPGTYAYVCVPHDLAGMVGVVVVREGG